MTDNTIQYETASNMPMEEDNVLETVNSAAFPTGFTSGSYNVMVILDTTLVAHHQRTYLVEALQRIIKGIQQSNTLLG